MKSEQVVLSVQNISKTYEASGYIVTALNKVSFDLYQGEMLAVMGTSGSGKSTLLNILGALDKPNEGVISLNGITLDNMFIEPFSTRYRGDNIGFVFQSYHLLKDLSVEENIALPLILKDVKDVEMKNSVNRMLDIVGLTAWRNHRPVQLSGGQQQRVAIARAIITNPPIVLADEPTGNLDYNTSTEILGVLVSMKERLAQSIIVVTHDPYVATFADRVLFFHDGEMIETYKCKKNATVMDNILRTFKKILECSI